MFRIANLLENKDDNSLDVCVENTGFETKEEAKSIIENTQDRLIINCICFWDKRDPKTIINDFAFTYKTLERVGVNFFVFDSSKTEYFFARYSGARYTPTLLNFTDYFSKRIK